MRNVGLFCTFILILTSFASCSDDEVKKSIPEVNTGAVTNITESSATLSGEITDDGNAEITETGFVYSSVTNIPETEDEKLVLGGVNNVLNGTLEELSPETTYYVRAYAINSSGTGYGDAVQFTTEELQPTTEGLVAYYTFEDNTNDQVGDQDAVPGGGAALTYSFINEENNKAVNFSNLNGTYAVIDDPFDFEHKTICFWVKVNFITENQSVIFASDNPTKQYGLVGVSSIMEAGQKKITLAIAGNGVTIPAVEGVWYHLTLVGDAKSYKYYVNGSLIAENTFDSYLSSGNGVEDTILGASRILSLSFDGSMDNLRIYNRSLSAEEIAIVAEH